MEERRNYDKDFKINAIEIYEKSNKSMATVAEELGIAKATFSNWVRTLKKEGHQSFPGKGHVSYGSQELQALRKELHHIRQERDILKKAVAIFSLPNGKGMNS